MVLAVRCASGETLCCSMTVKHSVPVAAEIKICLADLELNLSWLVSES